MIRFKPLRKKHLLLLGAIVITAAVVMVLTKEGRSPKANPGRSSAALLLDKNVSKIRPETVSVAPIKFTPAMTFPASTKALQSVDISAEASRLVTHVHPIGPKILRRGTPIITMDPGSLPAAIASHRHQIAYLKHQDSTDGVLRSKGFSSEARHLKIKADLSAAEAALAQAETAYDKTIIRMPFDGILDKMMVDVGALPQAGMTVANVLDLHKLGINFTVPETLWEHLRHATGVEVQLPNGTIVPAKLTHISQGASPATRSYTVDAVMDNKGLNLPQGFSVQARLKLPPTMGHKLPQQSLTLNDDGVVGVKIIDDQHYVRFLPITIIQETLDHVWVKGMPQTPLRVIINGQEMLAEGVPVPPNQSAASLGDEAMASTAKNPPSRRP